MDFAGVRVACVHRRGSGGVADGFVETWSDLRYYFVTSGVFVILRWYVISSVHSAQLLVSNSHCDGLSHSTA